MSERFDSIAVTKILISQPNVWYEFYVQDKDRVGRYGDRYARNRANILRIYAKRKGYPIEVLAQRQADGLIHCWGRWNEGGDNWKPPTGL